MNSEDVKNFTVYLKTAVTFALFNINLFVLIIILFNRIDSIVFFPRRNVRDDTNFSCRYDKVNDPHCPILRIGDILDNLKTNKVSLLREVNIL